MEIEIFSSYGLGYHARMVGTPKEKNPLPEAGNMHKKWNSGWDHANEDLKIIPKLTKVIHLKEIR